MPGAGGTTAVELVGRGEGLDEVVLRKVDQGSLGGNVEVGFFRNILIVRNYGNNEIMDSDVFTWKVCS